VCRFFITYRKDCALTKDGGEDSGHVNAARICANGQCCARSGCYRARAGGLMAAPFTTRSHHEKMPRRGTHRRIPRRAKLAVNINYLIAAHSADFKHNRSLKFRIILSYNNLI